MRGSQARLRWSQPWARAMLPELAQQALDDGPLVRGLHCAPSRAAARRPRARVGRLQRHAASIIGLTLPPFSRTRRRPARSARAAPSCAAAWCATAPSPRTRACIRRAIGCAKSTSARWRCVCRPRPPPPAARGRSSVAAAPAGAAAPRAGDGDLMGRAASAHSRFQAGLVCALPDIAHTRAVRCLPQVDVVKGPGGRTVMRFCHKCVPSRARTRRPACPRVREVPPPQAPARPTSARLTPRAAADDAGAANCACCAPRARPPRTRARLRSRPTAALFPLRAGRHFSGSLRGTRAPAHGWCQPRAAARCDCHQRCASHRLRRARVRDENPARRLRSAR